MRAHTHTHTHKERERHTHTHMCVCIIALNTQGDLFSTQCASCGLEETSVRVCGLCVATHARTRVATHTQHTMFVLWKRRVRACVDCVLQHTLNAQCGRDEFVRVLILCCNTHSTRSHTHLRVLIHFHTYARAHTQHTRTHTYTQGYVIGELEVEFAALPAAAVEQGLMLQGGAGWCRVVQGGAEWCRVVQGGAGWCKVVQGGAG